MDVWAIAAGGLVIISLALSFYEIIKHLCNYTKPYLQRYIIRILLMVPIYSLNAWIAMVLPATGLYLDSLREVYESFVIYSFMKYLFNFLQRDTNLQQYIHFKPGPRQIFPLCCLPACVGGWQFLIRCKHGILQYVVVRPITSLIAFASQIFGFYGEGDFNPLSGHTYPVLLLINNASQVLAMYCLVILYTGYQQELRPMQPLAKFFSIKLVVFFSFFQSVVIAGLLEIDLVEQTFRDLFPELDDKISLGRKVQELLICFDMLIAAIGHLYAFSYKPFTDPDDADDDYRQSGRLSSSRRTRSSGSSNQVACCSALWNLLDFSDEKSDISEHFGQIFDRIKRTFTFGQSLPAILTPEDSERLSVNALDEEYETNSLPTNVASATGETNVSPNVVRNYQSIE